MKSLPSMQFTFVAIFLLALTTFTFSCKKDTDNNPYPNASVEVVFDGAIFTTEINNRLGYNLKTWEFKNDGLKLNKVIVYEHESNAELLTLMPEDFGRIYSNPIAPSTLINWDIINHYYYSIQLPIAVETDFPDRIYHKLFFTDTINNNELIIEGGDFTPDKSLKPIIISSPTKGNRQAFFNQSTMGYHFDVLLFMDGTTYYPERYAIDQLRLNESYTDTYDGDPTINESYINYGDTVYAVADGTINFTQDGKPENNGNLLDVPLTSLDDYGGNMIIIDIGDGLFAAYAHLIPNSLMVAVGDNVKEGDPIALLGNSGNSTEPHLHFHISNSNDMWKAVGVPFMLKSYIKNGSFDEGLIAPELKENILMEQFTIFTVE